jgi:Bacterial TniB protein
MNKSIAGAVDDRRRWRKVPINERLAIANKLIVLHPRFREAVTLLERCHCSRTSGGEPACGALLGASGVGKTSVVEHYRKRFPQVEMETATRQPVLRVTLQPDARPKGIAADLLMALGDPAWSSGTVQTLTNRATHLLERCGVEMIVLDEFHHLFDIERAKIMTKAAQWLKVLIVNTRIPVVVCGMPEAEHVLSAEHTERRFKERLTLRCFSWRSSGRQEYLGMLKKLDTTLPLAESSDLADLELAGRIYLACRGVPDYLMTLIRYGLAEALGRETERIDMADFARVYEQRLAHQRVLSEQANPFVGALEVGALDRVQPADDTRGPGIGLTPRAASIRKKPLIADRVLGG